MSAQDALSHERDSAKHGQNVSDTEMWWSPAPNTSAWEAQIDDTPLTYEEMKMREHQIRVDHVRDMVPFWMRGVEAAERGEVLKMEEFLENLKQDSWENGGDPWGYVYSPGEWGSGGVGGGGWGGKGSDNWGGVMGSSVHARRTPSHSGENQVQGKVKRNGFRDGLHVANEHDDAYAFVEGIARREAADAERRRRMHMFFEMPTQEKIKEIKEVIRHLRIAG